MAGFELGTSDVGSDRSASFATTTDIKKYLAVWSHLGCEYPSNAGKFHINCLVCKTVFQHFIISKSKTLNNIK